MLKIIDFGKLTDEPALADSMMRDRGAQFVQRHSWDLPLTPDGREVDEFDAAGTLYLVMEERDQHIASVRLRPARYGSMVERHFRPLWDLCAPDLHDHWEVTRLLLSPSRAGQDTLNELLIGLCSLCLRQRIPTFFGVVFPSVARLLDRAGWPPRILGRMIRGEETLLLCTWKATSLVHWTLQERQDERLERAGSEARRIAA